MLPEDPNRAEVSSANPLADQFGRPLRSLRVSVTDRCNLRCNYCMPQEEYVWLPRQELLTFEEISRLVEGVHFAGRGGRTSDRRRTAVAPRSPATRSNAGSESADSRPRAHNERRFIRRAGRSAARGGAASRDPQPGHAAAGAIRSSSRAATRTLRYWLELLPRAGWVSQNSSWIRWCCAELMTTSSPT